MTTAATPVGLTQLNLHYQIPLDRICSRGTGRLNVFDSNNNLVVSVPATDQSITIKGPE